MRQTAPTEAEYVSVHAGDSGRSGRPASVLGLVCRRCIEDLGASDVTVVLASGDALWSPAYSTSTAASDLEQQAFTLGEGPCCDALDDHRPVLVADLDHREARARWPIWSAVASAAGVRSVAAFPIQAGAVAAGVLNLFFSEVESLGRERLALVLRLADMALLGVLDVTAGLDGANGAGMTSEVRFTRSAEIADIVRAEVHQAAGMIMVQADLSIMEALARLRARAFLTGRPLAEVARDVLDRRLRFSPERDSAE